LSALPPISFRRFSSPLVSSSSPPSGTAFALFPSHDAW
jgi:hypothetical protein